MRPPQHIVDEVQRLDRRLRVGAADGKFWLIQIYEGRANFPQTADDWRSRGPIYGAHWDPATQIAAALAYFAPEVFYSGEILQIVKDRARPVREIIAESIHQEAREADTAWNDLVEAAADDLDWRRQRSDANSPSPVPRKHLTKEEKLKLGGDHPSQLPPSHDILKTLPK